jgi:NADH-quinone oxidoreductase subunit N
MIAAPASTGALVDGTTTLSDMGHLAPMMIVALWSLVLLLTDAFAGAGTRKFQRRLAFAGVALAGAAALMQFGQIEYDAGVAVFGRFLTVDHFSVLLDLAVLGTIAGVIAFAGDYSRAHRFEHGEQESLIFIAAFGMMILNHSADLVALFLGIETMSIAVFVLVGARWNSRPSAEAALKYFLMGAFSSGLLLMGIALLYGALGTTQLSDMSQAIMRVFTQWGASREYADLVLHPENTGATADALRHASDKAVTGMAPAALFFPGVLLTLAALLFKVSAVPFHMWTPDAYDGAPTPTTGFMAAGVKIGAFAALLKLFVAVLSTQRLVTAPYGWTSAVALVALLTMTVGNLAAVRQSNLKRLLAYSSIAHVGYILVGIVAAANFYGHATFTGAVKPADQIEWSRATGDEAVAAVLYYVVTYAVATLGAFAAVAWYSGDKKEATAVHEWSGLAERHPGMALGLTVCVLSLMGLPPLAGFVGKLAVFKAALENDNLMLRLLVIAALLNSVVGAYYYLRLIVNMYFRAPPEREHPTLPGTGAPAVVAVAAALSIALGVGAGWALRRAELGARGYALPVGSERRAAWVDELRAKWEADDEAGEGAKKGEGDAKAKGEGDAKAKGGKAPDAKAPDAKAPDAKAPDAKAPPPRPPDAKAPEGKNP